MAYKCLHCGASHHRPETALRCAEEKFLKEKGYSLNLNPVLLDGYYLVTAKVNNPSPGQDTADIYAQIKTITSGHWKDRQLLNVYDAEGNLIGVPETPARKTILSLIHHGENGRGFRSAMLRFGKEVGSCPICAGTMEDPKELKDGVHQQPSCYQTLYG